MKSKKFFSSIGNIIKWMLIVFLTGSILLVFIYRYIPVYASPLMFIRAYEQVSRGEQIRWHHEWVPLEEMPSDMPVAAIACEDTMFLRHHGFNWDVIREVIREYRAGNCTRGGSTISQQVAKNVFLFPTGKNGKIALMRKGVEAYFTVLIEMMWDKQRIMEVYLNTIEMGDGIYGLQAVAHDHFDRDAKDLTRNQCAMIAITFPNPLVMNSAAPTANMYKRQSWCLWFMKGVGHFPMRQEND